MNQIWQTLELWVNFLDQSYSIGCLCLTFKVSASPVELFYRVAEWILLKFLWWTFIQLDKRLSLMQVNLLVSRLIFYQVHGFRIIQTLSQWLIQGGIFYLFIKVFVVVKFTFKLLLFIKAIWPTATVFTKLCLVFNVFFFTLTNGVQT